MGYGGARYLISHNPSQSGNRDCLATRQDKTHVFELLYFHRYLETQLWEFFEKVQHVQSINIFILGFFLEFLQSCGHVNWLGVLQCIFPIQKPWSWEIPQRKGHSKFTVVC